MSWRILLGDNTGLCRVVAGVVLFLSLLNTVHGAPHSGMLFAPSVDPFAPPNPPPPPYYAPQYAPQQQAPMASNNAFSMPQQQQAPMAPNNAFSMPQQQQQQQQPPPTPINYNQQPQYMALQNMRPTYPAMSGLPPPDAAPVGATAPGTSSQGEMEFESGQGGNGGVDWGNSGTSSNYIYPPTYPQSYPGQARAGQYSPQSLLDAYYHTPYQQGQRYYQQQRRNNNGLFGGLFGNTPSGNIFGALMLNEFVF